MSYSEKEYQKEYQKTYRLNNRDTASNAQKEWRLDERNKSRQAKQSAEWMKEHGNAGAGNAGQTWTNKEILLVTEKSNGKYTHRIKDMCKMIERSYKSIQQARSKYGDTGNAVSRIETTND